MTDAKLCIDCKHYVAPFCRHPNNMRANLVEGGWTTKNSAGFLRDEAAECYCGPVARWFEQAEKGAK